MLHEHTQLLAELSRQSLTLAQFNVLNAVRSVPLPRLKLVEHAVWLVEDNQVRAFSRAACELAVDGLIEQSYIQIMTSQIRKQIDIELKQTPRLGPMNGLGEIGTIELTRDGAAVWMEIEESVFGLRKTDFVWSEIRRGSGSASRARILATSPQLAYETRDQLTGGYIRRVIGRTDPIPVGDWCDYWWRTPAKGFQLEVEY